MVELQHFVMQNQFVMDKIPNGFMLFGYTPEHFFLSQIKIGTPDSLSPLT